MGILKQMITKADKWLTFPNEVANPPSGFDRASTVAAGLRDAFHAFSAHYFITDIAASSAPKSPRRPNTATGTRCDHTMRSRQRDPLDLGWWRATVRCSLEQARRCEELCSHTVSILSGCKKLKRMRASLRVSPELSHQIENFLELHSGIRGRNGELSEQTFRNSAYMEVQSVGDQLQGLVAQVEELDLSSDDCASEEEQTVIASTSGVAEILTLSSTPKSPGEGAKLLCRDAESLQHDINDMRNELNDFGLQLERISGAVLRTGSSHHKTPERDGVVDKESPDSQRDKSDSVTALEVAKRSSWYHEPPPLLPESVPLLFVQHKITTTPLTRCPSRPRSSQPKLLLTHATNGRPFTAPATCMASGLYNGY